MICGSVCSGIGAPEVAWEPLGWRFSFVSEIAAFPRAVLQHRHPGIPLHGDFTTIKGDEYDPIRLLVGGTPCQSFSVAGLRGGLADDRGNLALQFLKLADRLRPKWLVWENVPGVLSSNGGRDFGAILGGMVELGYGFAYRVLDAQHFGVPQRRRRVFVVGYSGDWRPAASVLFERHSLQGHSPPRREAGQGIAPTISARPTGGGGLGTDFDLDGGLVEAFTPSAHGDYRHGLGTLRAHGGDVGHGSEMLLARCDASGEGRRLDGESCTFVTHSLRGEDFDAGEDGTGRGTPLVPCFAIQERAVSENENAGPDGRGWGEGVAFTLESRQTPQAIAFAHQQGGSIDLHMAQGVALSLQRSQEQAIAFDLRGREGGAMPEGPHDTANIRAANGGSSRSYVAAVADTSQTISRSLGGPASQDWQFHAAALHGTAVRRLTPRECERLQGFPDDYTLIPWRNGMAPDGPRYKALGNSMAVPVMRWIGERIQAVEAIQVEREAAHAA